MAFHLELEQNEHVRTIKPLVENFLAEEPADIFIITDDGETVETHKMLLSMFSRSLASILSDHHGCVGVPGISVPMKAETVRNLVRMLGEGTIFGEDKAELLGVAKCGKLLGIEFNNLQIGGKRQNNTSDIKREASNETEKTTPDTKSKVPKAKNKVSIEGHEVFEKGSGVCKVDPMVNSYKDMLALGIATLRPLASKHGVRQCGKKQKAQVVEELWEHYLEFHCKQTENRGMLEPKLELSDTAMDLLEPNLELSDTDPTKEQVDPNIELDVPTTEQVNPNLEVEVPTIEQVDPNEDPMDTAIESEDPNEDRHNGTQRANL